MLRYIQSPAEMSVIYKFVRIRSLKIVTVSLLKALYRGLGPHG